MIDALRAWEEETKEGDEKEFKTPSGLEIKRLYTPVDLGDFDYMEKLGFPGDHPFTRGVYPTMYRSRLWTMRQYAGFGSAVETNERYRYLLSQGQTGLSVAFDLPTQIGMDSDAELAMGEVGKVGVAIDSIDDMALLFDSIPLDQISTSMTINSPAAVLLAMYIALGEKNGIGPSQLRGTVQNDILKEYVARGTYIYPPEPSMRLVADLIIYCAEEVPKWNAISISGYHMREAGCTAVQEAAFTLANGIAYCESVLGRMDIDDFGRNLSFFFACHNNFLEEIAKFRAARRVWAKIVRDRFHAKKDRSCMLRFHTQTSGVTLTAQQPENNIVRVTLQALAAALGGTQSLHTNSMDEALALPSEKAVRIALRTQQVLAYESGITETVDPLGGSYYLEWLTDKIEEEVWRYIDKIDEMGGMAKAIERGYIQDEIAKKAYEAQKRIDSGEDVVVGVNRFSSEEEADFSILRVRDDVEIEQKAKLKDLKKRRNSARVESSLEALKKGCDSTENLVPLIMGCVKSYATIGEICGAMKEIFGEYKPTILI
jgi:methylmalonyl-CoA mutase N-terminal domain/subunit